jgi:Domain of unknown function (DUF4926)
MMKNPELLDVVELVVNLPEEGLQVGAQGTIVECYGDDAYEVEFVNGAGETIAMVVLKVEQFVVAWIAESKQWVPVVERLEALMAGLPEATLLEVFDFARFVHSRRLAS